MLLIKAVLEARIIILSPVVPGNKLRNVVHLHGSTKPLERDLRAEVKIINHDCVATNFTGARCIVITLLWLPSV